MKKKLIALFLSLAVYMPVFAQQFPIESMDLNSVQEEAVRTGLSIPDNTFPEPVSPLKFSKYDYSGLPFFAFTEETNVSDVITRAIAKTNYTLDVALYNLQIPDAAKALIGAVKRGVKVRLVLDYEHVYPKANSEIQQVINSGMDIRIMKGRGGSGSMHNKYAIFDGSALETGSANWSLFAETSSFENMMFVFSPEIISGYKENFEWMWAQGMKPGQQVSSWAKPAVPPADRTLSVNFNGTALPDYIFSPRGGTEAAIIKALDAASSEIDVAMFSFTSKPIMEALSRARARGVRVKILTYIKSGFPFREEAKKSGIELRLKPGRTENGMMHNKYCVVDSKLLINGSYNWSDTAEKLNAENTIFTMDRNYVSAYKAEFDKLYARAIIAK